MDMYKKWLEQNRQLQDNFQQGFDRVTQQMSDIQKMSEAWSRIGEQMDTMTKRATYPSNAISSQFADMMKSYTMPWQQHGFSSIPNMLTGWAAFKTSIGSNGRISIPEAERSALGLKEGDLVQVIVLPVSKKKEVKE
jgi:AbrB family looped-hinge helix DNA binding protein